MVKVQKVAAWRIGEKYIEDAKMAEKAVRELVILEMLEQAGGLNKAFELDGSHDQVAEWVADNWETIEQKTKAAMAGT